MKIKFKEDWKNYYSAHCNHCLWTGCSKYVIGEDDGPFVCPYCYHSDPTDPEHFPCDVPTYSIKEFVVYTLFRSISLITHPIRFAYSKYVHHQINAAIRRR